MLAFALAACESQPVRPAVDRSSARSAPEVILISIDGYRADYLNRGDSPVLEQLAASGVRARWLIPSFPTLTEPNHYTLITGLYPDHHGIIDNDIADRNIQPEPFRMTRPHTTVDPRWWSEATPLWVTIQRDGMRAAAMDWPNGYVRIDGARLYLHRNGKQAGNAAEETSTVIRWLSLPEDRRPRLILLHYGAVDHEGHLYGPDSPELDDALREVDSAIGRLIAALEQDGLYDDADLIVVSDHGMASVPPGQKIYLDDIIDPRAVRIVTLGAESGINPRRSMRGDEATAALLEPHAHMRCWRKHDLPEHLHYGRNPRAPALECIASPGWIITTHRARTTLTRPLRGDHGYDNLAWSMRALFIAEGPSFRQGLVVPPFPNVDIYPLLAHILEVAPEKNDGNFSDVEPMLKPGGPLNGRMHSP
jgi:predicted AlkP superfamily pyrophosphatase or phosphodiesterase